MISYLSKFAHTHRQVTTWLLAAAVALIGTRIRVGVLALVAMVHDENLWDLLNSWDAVHYVKIAEEGYFGSNSIYDQSRDDGLLAFFPGFPFLVRAMVYLLGTEAADTAIALNVIFSVVMAAGAMALARRMGMGRRGELLSAVAVTCAPMSIVFAMPYSEALFGALALWTLVSLMDERWMRAGILIFIASFVRLTAVNLVIVFAIMLLLKDRRNWGAWVAAVVSALPLVGYIWWANRHLEEMGGYFALQMAHWESGFDGGKSTVIWLWDTLTGATDGGYLLTDGVIIAAPVFLVLAWRRLPLPAWLFAALLMANVLLSGGVMHSRPRLLLPAVIVLLPWVAKLEKQKVPDVLFAAGAWVFFGAWFSAYMLGVFEWAI